MAAIVIVAGVCLVISIIALIWSMWWILSGRARRYKQRVEYENRYMEYKAKFDAEHGIEPMSKEELNDFIQLHDLDRLL